VSRPRFGGLLAVREKQVTAVREDSDGNSELGAGEYDH
jgi:hypothetical protein